MATTQETRPEVQTRLFRLGFAFNPFERLEASNDPHISFYLIGHDMFSVAWETAPAALFAPPGGGKTAMRIYTLRACWKNEDQRRKFPISYDLPFFANLAELTSLEAHQTAIAAAAATDLFLACAYRPNLYLSLTVPRRLNLLSLLRVALPVSLEYALSILAESGDAQQLSDYLDRTYRLPDPPPSKMIQGLCETMQHDLEDASGDLCSGPAQFEALMDFIREDLHFESVLLLLDGVDGGFLRPEDLQAQFDMIAPLLQQSADWAKTNLFLKAFLPVELDDYVAAQAKDFYRDSSRAQIQWDIPKLAEILRRRVYVASQGRFGSLDALSSPALRDVETLIASRTRPLPREAIMLSGLVLQSYLKRGGEYLEPEDIFHAEQEYPRRSIFPN